MNSLMQLSRALMEAKQEKETAVAQALIEAKTERLESAADAKQQELLKVSEVLVPLSSSLQPLVSFEHKNGGIMFPSFDFLAFFSSPLLMHVLHRLLSTSVPVNQSYANHHLNKPS